MKKAVKAPPEERDDYLIHSGDGLHIAEVFHYQANAFPNGPAEANAKLIAQAPNLLAALKDGAESDSWDTEQWAAWQSDARTAIEAAS
jgi:hypothetical protein